MCSQPRSTDEFKDIMEEMKGYPCLAIDELGYGRSDSPLKNATIEESADSVIKVISEILPGKSVIVFGSLLGTYTAISMAARYPTHVCGIVLNNFVHFSPNKRAERVKHGDEKKRVMGNNERR